MKNILFILIAVLTLSCTTQTPPSQLSILENNWKNYLINEDVKPEMEPFFYNLNADGTWSDLDYTNRQRGNWPLRVHLHRVIEMAKAYQQEDNENYQNEELGKNIILAYNMWVDEDIINPNWWYPQIGIPQSAGLVMLLMRENIDEVHWQKGMTIMDRVEFGEQTGQNLVWVSSNIVLRSILKSDTTFVAKATSLIRREMQMANDKEGLQADYSFHQHGRQLQFGNYGLHYLEDQVKWMFILNDSEYNYTPEQIDLMREYFTHGQRWVIWKKVYDINSSGRQLFPDEQLRKYMRVYKAAVEMKKIDPEHEELYRSISEENELIGTKHFTFSELLVKRTKGYMTSIRTCSSRIKGSESGNGENLSGYYLSDGAMYVMKTGKEYYNIYPYWNWRQIPGTTAVQDTAKLPEIGWTSYNIESDFVGGLTYEDGAISTMQYKRDGVTANKSYFLFPDFTICLGSNINGQQDQHLQTTVEQCFSTTPLWTNNSKATVELTPQTKMTKDMRSFWHQGSGYIINDGKQVLANTDMKIGDWTKVVTWSSAKEEERNIFTLGIDHGKNVKDVTYAYAVFPKMDKADLATAYQNQVYQILSNTKEIQAVQFESYTSIVFHHAGTIKINDTTELSSNVPAVVICNTIQDQLSIAVCDPTQILESGQLTISKIGDTDVVTSVQDISFPTGIKKGTPVIVNK